MKESESLPSAPPHSQFQLRALFLATTAVALVLAELTGAFGPYLQAILWAILLLVPFVAAHLLAAAAFILPAAFALCGLRYLGFKLLGCVRGVIHANDPH